MKVLRSWKFALALPLLLQALTSQAAEPTIALHVGCFTAVDDCIEFPSIKGGSTLARKNAELILNENDVRAFEIVKDYSGRNAGAIVLTDEKSKAFEELTIKSISNDMVIVVDGQALANPRINEKISGGRFQITLGPDDALTTFVPWLATKAEDAARAKAFAKWSFLGAFTVLGLIAIVSVIYFAFGRRNRKT